MNKVTIYEVGPRDGFQNVAAYIPLEDKFRVVAGLVAAGLKHIQVTSFVSPKAIPQMRDARELAAMSLESFPDADLFALVPNLRGAETAWESGMKWISYVVSLSASHNQANIRRTHEESFAELLRIRERYPDLGICLDLSTAFGCPFEGRKAADEVVEFLGPYAESGIISANLCDTIGIANPAQVRTTIAAVRQAYPELDLQIHIHDTRNMGMVNTLAAIEMGVTKVQSTLGGLGGCPYAPGASGNLATEDLVFMLSEMGYAMEASVPALLDVARLQAELVPEGSFSGHLSAIADSRTACLYD